MDRLTYIVHRLFVKPALGLYLRRDRRTSYDGFTLVVRRGVFHPKLFFSTGILYGYLEKEELRGKKVLEIGCGSGLLSMLAYREGARVMAVDVDPPAVANTRENFKKNFADLSAVQITQSNVFSAVPPQLFDLVIINPPYYFKKVTFPGQHAWYCGEHGEYFQSLFSGLSRYLSADGKVLMILEENCDIDRIRGMAQNNSIEMSEVFRKKRKWETSFVFSLRPSQSRRPSPQKQAEPFSRG